MAPSDEDRRFEALLTPRVIKMASGAANRIVGAVDASDVVQEACISARKSFGTWRGEAQFSTWFYRVAVITALQHLRQRRRHGKPTLPFDELLPADDHAAGAVTREGEEQTAERRVMLDVIRSVLPKLSVKHRRVIEMTLFQGLKPTEISQELGINVLTIRTQLHYAKRHLVRYISEDLRGGELMRPSAAAIPGRLGFRALYKALWFIARPERPGSGGRPGPTRRLTYDPPQSLRGVIKQMTEVMDEQEVARMVRGLLGRNNWVEQVHGENDIRLLMPPSDSEKDDDDENDSPPPEQPTGPSHYVIWHFLYDERSKEVPEGEYRGKRRVRNPDGQIAGKWRGKIDLERAGELIDEMEKAGHVKRVMIPANGTAPEVPGLILLK